MTRARIPAGPRRSAQLAALGVCVLTVLAGCGPRRAGQPIDRVVLITLDTTRADALAAYGNRRVLTPNLDALAAAGNLFEQAYSHAPITLPSHSSILSGRLPTQHGVRNNIAYSFPPGQPTLAGRLQASGFATAAFVSSFILDRRFGLESGFDLYEDRIVHYGNKASKTEITTRRAHVTTDLFLEWEARQPGRYFAWVHFYDAHWPYEPPLPFRQAYADQPYLGEVASMDLQIGRIIEQLRRQGRLDSTLIVVTADHGEAFMEHGEQTHGYFCYASTTHVPLIVSLPLYAPAGSRIRHLVQGIDLAPSILEALGLPGDTSHEGRPLGDSGARTVYAEAMIPYEDFYLAPVHALRDERHSFYFSSEHELYDLHQDPAEQHNLIAEKPKIAARMAEEVQRRIDEGLENQAEKVSLDQESAQLLASLGYIGGGTFGVGDGDPYRFPSPKSSVGVYRELQRLRQFEETFPFKMIEGLERLIADHPRQAILYRDLGRLHTFAGNEEPALDNLAKAAWLKPEDPRLHVFRGLGYYRFGRFEESAAELRVAVELDPLNAQGWYNLGLAEIARDRLEPALDAFRKAIEANPIDVLALNNLAYLHLTRLDDPLGAKVYIDRAHAASPTQPLVLANQRLIDAALAERNGTEPVVGAPVD